MRTFVVPAGDGLREPRHARASKAMPPARPTSSPPALLGGGPVRVTGVGRDSIQGDVAFADVLARQGADVRFGPTGSRRARGGTFRGGTIDCVAIPDAAMTLAITALFADAPTTLTGIGSLAREGNRPARGDGHRTAQARRHGGGGAGLAAR